MGMAIKIWYEDQMESIIHYIEQLFAGAWVKGLLAGILTIYIELFHGNIAVLNIYFIFAVIDLVLGTWYAHRVRSWSPRYVLYWLRKLVAYVGLVSLFGGLCLTITITTGENMGLVNWLLLCCTITEFGSILKNLKKLGVPLPPVLEVLLRLIRKQASEKIAEKLGVIDEEDKKELEVAIAGGKIKDRRGGDRRRKNRDTENETSHEGGRKSHDVSA